MWNPAPAEYPLELSVNDLLFTGLKGSLCPHKLVCEMVSAHTPFSKPYLFSDNLRCRFANVNDAAESPHKADIFLVLSEFYEYLNHML